MTNKSKTVALVIMDTEEFIKMADLAELASKTDYFEADIIEQDMPSAFVVKVIKRMLPKMTGAWVRGLWK